MDEALVNWTARLAVAAYLIRLWFDVAGAGRESKPCSEPTVRNIWTLGCLSHLLHVTAAFYLVHHWSHAAAHEHTARQTAALTGWYWGGGLWINYAFTIWWPLDVLWCWRRGMDRLPRWYIRSLHAIVGFLVFNATIVFGSWWWRWAGVLVLAAAIGVALNHRSDQQSAAPD